jgi:hypothetical protein
VPHGTALIESMKAAAAYVVLKEEIDEFSKKKWQKFPEMENEAMTGIFFVTLRVIYMNSIYSCKKNSTHISNFCNSKSFQSKFVAFQKPTVEKGDVPLTYLCSTNSFM